MGIEVATNFFIGAQLPVDDRYEVQTIAERDAIPTTRRFPGLQCYVQDTNTIYFLDNALVTWRPIGGSLTHTTLTGATSCRSAATYSINLNGDTFQTIRTSSYPAVTAYLFNTYNHVEARTTTIRLINDTQTDTDDYFPLAFHPDIEFVGFRPTRLYGSSKVVINFTCFGNKAADVLAAYGDTRCDTPPPDITFSPCITLNSELSTYTIDSTSAFTNAEWSFTLVTTGALSTESAVFTLFGETVTVSQSGDTLQWEDYTGTYLIPKNGVYNHVYGTPPLTGNVTVSFNGFGSLLFDFLEDNYYIYTDYINAYSNTRTVSSNETVSVTGFAGGVVYFNDRVRIYDAKRYVVDIGTSAGTISGYFDTGYRSRRMIVNYDGQQVHDTKYIGTIASGDETTLTNLFNQLYIPLNDTLSAIDVNNNAIQNFTFAKSTSQPTTAEIYIYAPLSAGFGDPCEFRIDAP